MNIMTLLKGAQFYLTLFIGFVTIFGETGVCEKFAWLIALLANAYIVRYWYRKYGENAFYHYTGIDWLEAKTGFDFRNE